MEIKEFDTVIILRNDSSTAWATSSTVLEKGELGVCYLDNGNVIVKVGDGEHSWANLHQVESVLEKNMILTHSFGKYSVPSGESMTIENSMGKTLSQWLEDALKETIDPVINTYPKLGLSISYPSANTKMEVGSYINTCEYIAALIQAGNYKVGDKIIKSGIKGSDITWNVDCTYAEYPDIAIPSSSSAAGSFNFQNNLIQVNAEGNKTYATLTAHGDLSLTNVVTPTNNLGESAPDVKIKGFDNSGAVNQSVSADLIVNGYRKSWSYVGVDKIELSSTFIRDKGTELIANNSGGYYGSITIKEGTKSILIAMPGDRELNSVIDEDGMALDVKANFIKTFVDINGANDYAVARYTVFYYEAPLGLAATRYTFNIK